MGDVAPARRPSRVQFRAGWQPRLKFFIMGFSCAAWTFSSSNAVVGAGMLAYLLTMFIPDPEES